MLFNRFANLLFSFPLPNFLNLNSRFISKLSQKIQSFPHKNQHFLFAFSSKFYKVQTNVRLVEFACHSMHSQQFFPSNCISLSVCLWMFDTIFLMLSDFIHGNNQVEMTEAKKHFSNVLFYTTFGIHSPPFLIHTSKLLLTLPSACVRPLEYRILKNLAWLAQDSVHPAFRIWNICR
jgi:hypothetical protein